MINFDTSFKPLVPEIPEMGSIALLPWDEETFGFKVASYKVSSRDVACQDIVRLKTVLLDWMVINEVELLDCSVPADAFEWIARLGAMGFAFVDLSLLAFARELDRLPEPSVEVRLALDEDRDVLVRIAGQAFKFGRYHADPRFPKHLADERYRQWIIRGLKAQKVNPNELVLVTGEPGRPTGFIHAKIDQGVADLRLAAVDPLASFMGALGPGLFAATLTELRDRGARRFKTRPLAANTLMLSLYSMLGFHFREPEVVLHLHSPRAKHLLPLH